MNSFTKHFHANGKLLLSGEYFVLDGALALAVPTKQGQSLIVEEQESFAHISWESVDAEGQVWFKALFSAQDLDLISTSNDAMARRLQQILEATQRQNPKFLPYGAIIKTELEFPREWGLGTSSTLLHNIAEWAKIDAYQLLSETFGGSGYDLACAGAESAIFYRLEDKKPIFHAFPFQPAFIDNLYFVYLDKKQNSREGIAHYRAKVKNAPDLVKKISNLTEKMSQAGNLSDFEDLIKEHEEIVSATLEMKRAKDLYFTNYWGEIKSLGAWGGDFVLVTSNKSLKETTTYFAEQGFEICLPFSTLVG